MIESCNFKPPTFLTRGWLHQRITFGLGKMKLSEITFDMSMLFYLETWCYMISNKICLSLLANAYELWILKQKSFRLQDGHLRACPCRPCHAIGIGFRWVFASRPKKRWSDQSGTALVARLFHQGKYRTHSWIGYQELSAWGMCIVYANKNTSVDCFAGSFWWVPQDVCLSLDHDEAEYHAKV